MNYRRNNSPSSSHPPPPQTPPTLSFSATLPPPYRIEWCVNILIPRHSLSLSLCLAVSARTQTPPTHQHPKPNAVPEKYIRLSFICCVRREARNVKSPRVCAYIAQFHCYTFGNLIHANNSLCGHVRCATVRCCVECGTHSDRLVLCQIRAPFAHRTRPTSVQ